MPIGMLTRKIQFHADLGDDPAEQHADGSSTREDEADDTHRLGALGGLGEHDHEQRQHHDRDDRAADTLSGPRDDEELLGVGQTACERRDREDGDADEEQPPVTEEISEPPTQKQEAAERQQVRVHHPRERGLREPRSSPIAGSATFTIVVSSTIMMSARQSR